MGLLRYDLGFHSHVGINLHRNRTSERSSVTGGRFIGICTLTDTMALYTDLFYVWAYQKNEIDFAVDESIVVL